MHTRVGKIRMQALLLSAAPLLFLVLLAVFAALLVSNAQSISASSQQATRVLGESDALSAIVTAAARSVTDYTSSHRPADLRNYRRWAAAFPGQAKSLLALTTEQPAVRASARRYVAATHEGMIVIARYLALMQAGHASQARAYAASPPVRRLSLTLNSTKSGLDKQERSLTMSGFDAFSRRLRFALAVILLVCLCGIAATLLAMTHFGLRIVRRLELLASNVRRLGSGESVQAIDGNDEIATLDRLYQEITRRLREALRQKDELLFAYEREHHVASTLQQALLPQNLPVVPGVRIDAAYVPAAKSAEIGGDWYDVFSISERSLGIGVGDVAGHDLQAATVMGSARQAIRIAAREDPDPASVLRRVNHAICADDQQRMVTAFFGVLDLADGKLRYAVAGHPPPFLVTPERETSTLEGSGIALGVNRRSDFTTYELCLGLGNALVLYTDGMVEAERDYDKGMAALEAAIRVEAFSPGGNIAEQIQRRIFAGVQPRDDSAVLFVGITDLQCAPASALRQTWKLDAKDESAAHRVKRAVLWHLGEIAAPASDFAAVEAIVGELVSNVARHTPGDAEVTLECDDRSVALHVSDRGKAFRSTGEHVPDVLAEGGRGLFLVRALAERLDVVHTSAGNRVSVLLPVAIGSPLSITAA
ncbi:MAG TPA: ATP-binding SpoIIE family protein phosphatase [Candidatus Dormibacteraeota bacterium]|nr:ATP-binding SpoIIE family protein phosphatase [Candidatus Dormibacteraeota bacterium]